MDLHVYSLEEYDEYEPVSEGSAIDFLPTHIIHNPFETQINLLRKYNLIEESDYAHVNAVQRTQITSAPQLSDFTVTKVRTHLKVYTRMTGYDCARIFSIPTLKRGQFSPQTVDMLPPATVPIR